jgi:hypothetical protein
MKKNVHVLAQGSCLPRLLYFGDVPVESSYHGSALLFRLLEEYPVDRLLAIESEPSISRAERRLPGVTYRTFFLRGTRWRYTRLSRWANALLTINAPQNSRRLARCLGGFNADAVLTVAHGHSWLVAAQLAKRARLPLHLIIHDDVATTNPVPQWLAGLQERQFRRTYQQATSRLCVSEYMEHEYRRQCGVTGQVLYPSRAKNCPSFECAPKKYQNKRELVGAYAGNIFHPGYAQLISRLSRLLEERGGRLLLFGPHSRTSLQAAGLARPNVLPQGLIDSRELIHRLRDEADFLFIPMAFDPGAERNMRAAFPSKLADYTATGLPLLIWGPSYASAVRWAQRYGTVAEVVTSEASDEIDAALSRLAHRDHRDQLGRASSEVGAQLFSHSAAVNTFRRALMVGR